MRRARGAHRLGQTRAAARGRHEAEGGLGQPEARARADETHVARQCPLEPARDGGALDDGDRDERSLGQRFEDALALKFKGVHRARVGDAFEVGAGAEEARVR